MPQFSKRSLQNLKGVHPDLVKILEAAIKDSPVDFTITEGVRTLTRQQELYAQGRTKPGRKVTNADGVRNKSSHQPKDDGYGHAVDLYPYFDGQVQVHHPEVPKKQKEIADHIKKKAKAMGLKIIWGGDWRNPYDPPHFQRG
ncbi:M15 family metallopeptidase [Chryseobacterium sp. MFBS3-17]|uniref:M15 family metallopeptidase n=1 Tax=Chryseobacterium sp. MFBS3-17 TaxID=2886689 RepID=UPI001D0E53AF|nr:M15 family metallopeptidase [Chryseobacterium sp. MFBS3-17]MCC2590375.1 M15 family metallopeptidase [Chryseobacterium sp. MFBS3-17]